MSQVPEKKIKFSNILLDNYKVNSEKLTKVHLGKINKIIQILVKILTNNDVLGLTVTIVGHADYDGDEPYNLNLGERRAKATQDYLKTIIIRGKSTFWIDYVIKSFGETKPISPNSSKQGKSKNRRVEIGIELTIKRKNLKPKKEKVKKPKPSIPIISLLTSECLDAKLYGEKVIHLYIKRVQHNITILSLRRELMMLQSFTVLHWERGSKIQLLLDPRQKKTIELLKRNIKNNDTYKATKGKLSDDDIYKAINGKLIDKVKGPLENFILGEKAASRLGVILSHVGSLKMIYDDIKNERIMNTKEGREEMKRKLISAAYVHEDLLGSAWVRVYKIWKRLDYLEQLCTNTDPLSKKPFENKFELPPNWIK